MIMGNHILNIHFYVHICYLFCGWRSNMIFYMFVLKLLQLCCFDIELNPGPRQSVSRMYNRNIQVANINVNSLRYKTDLIFSELGDCDIICVTETKLDDNICNTDILLDNFQNPQAFRKDRVTDRGGGILLYIREGIIAKRRNDLEIAELESLCVEIITKTGKFILACFYRPPNAPISSWDNFDSLICNVIDTGCNIIVLGDINNNLLRHSILPAFH